MGRTLAMKALSLYRGRQPIREPVSTDLAPKSKGFKIKSTEK
jgi:hypothetical protein